MNDSLRQWLARAAELRRKLADKPNDAELLAQADALAQEGRRLGLTTKHGRDIDLGWVRRP